MNPVIQFFTPLESPPSASSSPSRNAPPSDPSDASAPRVAAVPGNSSAYSQYRWEEHSHRLLDRPPNRPGLDYSGFILGSCRAGGILSRARIFSETEGEDIFEPRQIRALIKLMGFPDDTSALVLDQDRREAGHLCVEIADRRWVMAMIGRLQDRCDQEVKNESGCEALVESLRQAVYEKTAWENFVDTLPVGTGFFAPGAFAAGLGMLVRMLWNHFRGGPPSNTPNAGSDRSRAAQANSEPPAPTFSRSTLILGAAIAAESVLMYLSDAAPEFVDRIGTVAESVAAAAAGAPFAPVSLRQPCNTQLGMLFNSQCEGGT